MSKLLDIILPTYNNRIELFECLKGFEVQTIQDFRLIVCIDGSTDGTHAALEQYCAKTDLNILVVQHVDGNNHGRNATRNLALPHVNASYVVFLDTDAVPAPDFLQQHLLILQQQECISAGDLIYVNADSNRWAAYLHTRGKKRFPHNVLIPFQYITTGNLAMPLRYFVEIGGQDSAMRTYGGGDTEFAYRLHTHFSPQVFHAQKAIAYSIMQKSVSDALNQMEEFGSGNLRYIRSKHPDYTEIFKMGLILGESFYSKLIRIALHPFAGYISELMVRVLPAGLANVFMSHAVLSRILKGFRKGQESHHA